ncbi:hypothetical protein BO71DRAFT_461785 [Aspergillus ellipticus CBS 707.79]|uniref:Dienelactone hydrolase n=1 Tax=Aspergillus ellipticus CBS 707.79 TaxID=1448320 RepID=A0A319DHN1_9EURO|nr:hypothetical protein BO71DRAFT_461785 [Aspergillus ellipticus CBS 707.79]
MDRLRQHLRSRRSSSSSSTTPLQSPPGLSLLGSSSSSDKSRRREVEASVPRRLYVTSNSPDFDPGLIARFRAEGFDVEYLPFPGSDRKELENLLHTREDDLEPGERYAVVAYNKPAHLLLESHHQPSTATNPFPRLCALIAYYPDDNTTTTSPSPTSTSTSTTPTSQTQPQTTTPLPFHPQTTILPPDPSSTTTTTTTPTTYPPSVPLLPIQIHLPGTSPSAASSSSSPTTTSPTAHDSHPHTRKRHRCHLFFYPESRARFAEPGEVAYDCISARLAWSRALEGLRRGFGGAGGSGSAGAGWRGCDVEGVWEVYWRCLGGGRDEQDERERRAAEIVGLMVGSGLGVKDEAWMVDEKPVVNCVPTLGGGTTPKAITSFYTNEFLPVGPPDQHIRLLSRTTGPDRVVDELLLSFTHTEEIPWLLPRVPPTDRPVRVALVMSASFCAGKLARLNIYWDQASVLVQIGLLDPALVPVGFRATGLTRDGKAEVDRIPVVGAEGVDRIVS